MPTTTEPPSRLTAAAAGTDRIRDFSRRLANAQRPLHLSDALAWDPQIEHEFLSRKGRELPRIDRDCYRSHRLAFDPERKLEELQDIERDLCRTFAPDDCVGAMLIRVCRESAGLVRLMMYRGMRTFSEISQRLFGSALSRQCESWTKIVGDLSGLGRTNDGGDTRVFTAEEAVGELTRRLEPCFPDWQMLPIRFVDGPAADSECLKLRRGRNYSAIELRVLEVHDGWVHLGTTYNGLRQDTCLFLSLNTPSSTRTQEGLAILVECLTGAMSLERFRKLDSRVRAIRMAEMGADFCQVYRFYCEHTAEEREAYRETLRVFRGSLPQGCGPFTKDLSHAIGLPAVWEALANGNPANRAASLALLFAGKTAVEDLTTLRTLEHAGLLAEPAFVPRIPI